MIRRNKKDLFLKIAGRRYTPRLCRVFRRQLILVLYAATRVHALSPLAKRASSDIITVTFAVLPGRRRRFRIQLTKTPNHFRQHKPSPIPFFNPEILVNAASLDSIASTQPAFKG